MTTHRLVIESVAGNATENATIEVSSLTANAAVSFSIRNSAGTVLSSFTLNTNADCFVSTTSQTSNLFTLTSYQDAVVTVSCSEAISVVLRHTTTVIGSSPCCMVAVPTTTDAQATSISFPTGSVGTGAHAMVTNSTATAIQVALRYGTNGTIQANPTIPANGFVFIDITNNDARAYLSSGTAFTVQYLVTRGTSPFIEAYIVP